MDVDRAETMTVEVWADVVCPWCRLGKAYLDVALSRFDRAEVDVVWRSFELDPQAPTVLSESLSEHLVRKLGSSEQHVAELNEMIRVRGQAVGVDFRFDQARPGNTFDAHRLLHLAKEKGAQAELADHLFRAYFTDGQPIGEASALESIAVASGLDPIDVKAVLASDRYAADVRQDEAEARTLQVTGVPFFVFDRRVAAGGAQPPDVLLAGLEQAWAARST